LIHWDTGTPGPLPAAALPAGGFGKKKQKMKRVPVLLAALAVWPLGSPSAHAENVLAVDNPAGHGAMTGVYATGQLFAGDDNLGVAEYLHNWHGDYQARSGSNIGLLSGRAETGLQAGAFRIGYLGRANGLVQMDRSVADLVHIYQNHQGYQAGERLGGHYSLAAFSADGLHLSDSVAYTWQDGVQLSLGAGASYLRGQWLKMQTADGYIEAVSQQDFSYAAQMQEARGRLADGHNDGYAVDAGAVLAWRDGTTLSLAVNDLVGQMHWRNAFTQQDVANSVTVNGSPSAQKEAPVWQDLALRLHPRWEAAASLPRGPLAFKVGIAGTQGVMFPQAGVAYRFGRNWQLETLYDFRFQTLGFTVSSPWLSLGVRSQNWLSPGQSRAYGLSGQLFRRF
jgi:hypothetical protein